jgi:hypothetical protein
MGGRKEGEERAEGKKAREMELKEGRKEGRKEGPVASFAL